MLAREDRAFQDALDHYQRAQMAVRPDAHFERAATFCGRRVNIGLAGQSLVLAMEPTFRHLLDDDMRDASTHSQISLWDCKATGVDRPPDPGPADWALQGVGWNVRAYSGGRYLCESRPATELWLDRSTGHLLGCYEDARALNQTARARPFFSMMSIFCRSLGALEVHAALVSCKGKGVLIVGGGGRGKSTSALDGLYGGLEVLGDDSVAIGRDSFGDLTGYSLYASARVKTEQTKRWPAFQGAWLLPQAGEEKALFLPALSHPSQMRRSTRIVAVAVPHIGSGRLDISRCKPIVAIHAMLHESRENRRFGMTRDDFALLMGMLKALPCYRFEVDRDPHRVSQGLRGVIERESA